MRAKKMLKIITRIIQKKYNRGYCTICEKNTFFIKYNDWLRDYYFCIHCKSIPRQRALINTLNLFYPNWKSLIIHESSPCEPSLGYFKKNCKNYSASYCFNDVKLGDYKNNYRCENLENLTFDDNSFDLFITQDVFEHIMNPESAFKEIARVLKPGGAHVFTMPLYTKMGRSIRRASEENGEITYPLEPVYHGNPINSAGSLVTFDWGRDFPEIVFKSSGLYTTIFLCKNEYLGLEAELLEVFISKKLKYYSREKQNLQLSENSNILTG